MEVGLPDLSGRQQVFRVHTAPLLTHGALGRDVDLWELARRSQNFTGAEIEGVVKVRAGRAPGPPSFLSICTPSVPFYCPLLSD